MKFQLKSLILIFFLLLLFFPLARSLTVTCDAGGPYGSGSTVIVTGNASGEASNITNVTVNISKSGILISSMNTTSDSGGLYYTVFPNVFDVGSYALNVSAINTTDYATCNSSFDVFLQGPIKTCEQKTLTVEGRTMYAAGNLVDSGKVFLSLEETEATNITSFSGGNFSISLTTCLFTAKNYILHLLITDDNGRKGTTYLSFTPT